MDFITACDDAGNDSWTDLPVFDFMSSENEAIINQVSDALQTMFGSGVSPEEGVAALEDRDAFIEKWGIDENAPDPDDGVFDDTATPETKIRDGWYVDFRKEWERRIGGAWFDLPFFKSLYEKGDAASLDKKIFATIKKLAETGSTPRVVADLMQHHLESGLLVDANRKACEENCRDAIFEL